jgi:DNA-binding response OmpR family regulator
MHIFIGEDDAFLQKVYTTELIKAGYDVSAADDGEQLLSRLRTQKPDLLLLDVLMPKKNGFEVLEEMKRDPALKKIPVIMLTSLGQEADMQRAKSLGVENYFVKSDMDLDGLIFLIKTLSLPASAHMIKVKKHSSRKKKHA